MKIAAIQLDAVFADVKANLDRTEHYIRQAASAGADLVLLPEFFTSAIGFTRKMLDVAIWDEQVPRLLNQWATEYGVIIGGSYIAFDGDDAFNKFTLVFPGGEVFEHRKDIPTQFENCYYTNGDENNILVTPAGNFGVAICWEMIRYQTLKRIAGKADLVLSVSCWWDLPMNIPPEGEALRQYNQNLACEAPVTLAKLLGVPVIHATLCGTATALNFPSAEKTQTRQFVGSAQIIDGNGLVLVKKHFSEGGGFVMSDVSWNTSSRKRPDNFPSKYWVYDLPDSYIHAWETANPIGKHYYNTVTLPYYKSRYKHNRKSDK